MLTKEKNEGIRFGIQQGKKGLNGFINNLESATGIEIKNSGNYHIGVEREGLRCDRKGMLSKLPHPEIFGNRMKNRFISTDFGESQLELRTLPYVSVDECYEKLYEITNVVLRELYLRQETLWYYSLPCTLPVNNEFVFNDYTGYPEEEAYEHYIVQKYGYRMHQMSSIHFGFSIEEDTFDRLRKKYPHIPENNNEAYMLLMRNFMKKRWFTACFFGATSLSENGEKQAEFSLKALSSGFGNGSEKWVNFSDFNHYIDSIEQKLQDGTLYRYGELYIPIRAREFLRTDECKTELEAIKKYGIEYVEIRMGEINPFDICGISKVQLSLMTAFLFSCLTDDSPWETDFENISKNGLTDEVKRRIDEELHKCRNINELLGLGMEKDLDNIQRAYTSENLPSQQISRIPQNEFFKDILERSKSYAYDAYYRVSTIRKYPKLEESTVFVIKDALLRGVDYKIIDEAKSIVEFSDGIKKEYIVQATKTRKDSYIFPYITDDKILAKEIMLENGIPTPEYIHFTKEDYKKYGGELFVRFKNMPIVIKPKSTNYGTGITNVEDCGNLKLVEKAVQYAFLFDDELIAERYIFGNEYRFFLVDGVCESVVWRRNASVVGDGIHTVKELISLREQNYRYQICEKHIPINDIVYDNLAEIGMTMYSVPEKDRRIFLQKVSNATLGGETVDCTKTMPDYFKRTSEKLAKCFNAFICGVDIIIPDIEKSEHYILEINDNPGLFISEVPYEGQGVRLGLKILRKVGFNID